MVGGLRRRLAGRRGLHGLGVRQLLRRPRGRRQGGQGAAHVRQRLARPPARTTAGGGLSERRPRRAGDRRLEGRGAVPRPRRPRHLRRRRRSPCCATTTGRTTRSSSRSRGSPPAGCSGRSATTERWASRCSASTTPAPTASSAAPAPCSARWRTSSRRRRPRGGSPASCSTTARPSTRSRSAATRSSPATRRALLGQMLLDAGVGEPPPPPPPPSETEGSPHGPSPADARPFGLVIAEAEDQFLLVGQGVGLDFSRGADLVEVDAVEEGRFDVRPLGARTRPQRRRAAVPPPVRRPRRRPDPTAPSTPDLRPRQQRTWHDHRGDDIRRGSRPRLAAVEEELAERRGAPRAEPRRRRQRLQPLHALPQRLPGPADHRRALGEARHARHVVPLQQRGRCTRPTSR